MVQPPREMVWWLLEVGMMVRRWVMKVVVAEGHDGWRKQRKDQLQEKRAGKAGFRPTLSSIFFFLWMWNLLLFIRVEEGNPVFTGEQFLALDSVGKDPNRWLKVGMVHCQISAAACLRWPLWGGAMSVYLPVSRWWPYPDIEGCLVISFVQGLANLVDVRYIKCTCKGGDMTSFSGKIKKIMNSDQTTRRLVLSLSLSVFTQNGAVLVFK